MRWLGLSDCRVDLATGAIVGRPAPSRLTSRELALLVFLAERPGEAVDRDVLLRSAFGYAPGARSRAVDKAMTNLRAKIERAPTAPEHLVTVQGVGYRFVPAPPGRDRAPSQVPFARDDLVGRHAELAELAARLEPPGLVTLKGPPGVGKSRLAAAAATAMAAAGRAVAWCALAPARSGDDLVRIVAAALEQPTGDLAALGRALAARGPALVVLDNLEHLVAEANVVDALLDAAPAARVLATSRIALGLRGERVLPVHPLDRDASVALLGTRAAAAGVDPAALPPDGLAHLADRLGDLPLALELAAPGLTVFGPAALADQLRLGVNTALPGLAAALDRSWRLLDGPEQTALAELSALRDGFTPEAAEAIASPAADGRSTAALLVALERGSWIHRRWDGRLAMLEPIRDHAAGRLAALGPEALEATARAHAAWFARLGSPDALAAMHGPTAAERAARLDAELGNVLEGLRWAVARREAALAVDLCGAACTAMRWFPRGPVGPVCDPVLALALSPDQRCRVLLHRAKSDPSTAAGAAGEAAAIARELGDAVRLGTALCLLGWSRMASGAPGEAVALLTEGVEACGDAPVAAGLRLYLAQARAWLGDPRAALSEVGAVTAELRRADDRLALARALVIEAEIAASLGEIARADRSVSRGLAVARSLGNARNTRSMEVVQLAILLRAERDADVAALAVELARRCLAEGYPGGAIDALVLRSEALGRLGRTDEARAAAEEALDRVAAFDHPRMRSNALTTWARALIRSDEPRSALAPLAEALAIARGTHSPATPFVGGSLAWALHAAGDADAASEQLGLADAALAARAVADPSVRAELDRVRALIRSR